MIAKMGGLILKPTSRIIWSISTLRSSWRWWTLPVWHISCHSFSSALTFHNFADDIFKAFQARSTSSRRVHLRTWNLPALLYFGAVFPCFRNTRSHFLQLDLLKSMSGRILFISHGNSMALCTTPRLPKWRALMTNWLNDASSLPCRATWLEHLVEGHYAQITSSCKSTIVTLPCTMRFFGTEKSFASQNHATHTEVRKPEVTGWMVQASDWHAPELWQFVPTSDHAPAALFDHGEALMHYRWGQCGCAWYNDTTSHQQLRCSWVAWLWKQLLRERKKVWPFNFDKV